MLTSDEKRAIRALQRVAKMWPKTLCLYSNGITLQVLRVSETGGASGHDGEIERERQLAMIDIHCEAGDLTCR